MGKTAKEARVHRLKREEISRVKRKKKQQRYRYERLMKADHKRKLERATKLEALRQLDNLEDDA